MQMPRTRKGTREKKWKEAARSRSQGEAFGGTMVWQCDDAGTQKPTKAM
jgi:hypothetical protein